ESLTDAYPTQRGPLPPVVFREPDTGKFQPLPEVPGKGKEKVGEEQAAQVLLNLQTPKKKSSCLNNTYFRDVLTFQLKQQVVKSPLPYMPSWDYMAVIRSLMKKGLQRLEVEIKTKA
ncbi:hypothetical protein Tco_0504242, partial [Tanacetum coccineum]